MGILMQQGPEQSRQKMQAFIDLIRSEPAALEPYYVRNEQSAIVVKDTTESLAFFVRTEAAKRKIALNTNQSLFIVGSIIQQNNCTANEVIALATKAADPNVSLALRMAVAIIVSTISPSAAGKGIALDVTRETLHYLLDNKLGVYKSAVDALCGMDLLLGEYGIRSLGGQAASYVFEEYGRLGYLALPLAILLYSKGPSLIRAINDSHLLEAGGDLIDMMGGFADDETHEKYRGSLATMPIDEVTSNVIGGISSTATWLWNKVPAIRSQALTLPLPSEAASEVATERAAPRLD